MRTALVTLESTAPYSQSRAHETPPLPRETADAYELRTWREKCHTTKDGRIFIPPMGIKMSLDTAAQMLGVKIAGKGRQTYTKFFTSGVLCMEPVVLSFTKEEVPCDKIYANANGRRGSGTRVWRYFPRIDEWEAQVPFVILSNEITKEIFESHLQQAGAFVGIGRFRPQNGGYYGRFSVRKIEWI